MTDEKPLPTSNPHRSEEPVRQLSASDLGISVPNTDPGRETDRWDELREALDTVSADGIRVAVSTSDSTVVTSIDIQSGATRPIHAIELGVWKAYSESQSKITHILVDPPNGEFTPCGRCLQTILDYSDGAHIRIVHPSENRYDEYSLNQGAPLLESEGDLTENGSQEEQAVDTDESQSDSVVIPESPPHSDVEVEGNPEIEFVRLNAPVYHLKYQSHSETFCGTNLSERESVSGTTKPTLLEPCKRCHGETNVETVKEQRVRLRRELSESVDAIGATGEDATTFSKEELEAFCADLPVEVPAGEISRIDLRKHLSRVIVDINDDQENPLTFSRDEMEALLEALGGDGTIPEEPQLLTHTTAGRIARVPLSELTLQHRGGKGQLGISLSEDESPTTMLGISPREKLYLFTNLGQIYQMEAHRIPEVDRGGDPVSLADLIKIDADEKLQAAFTCTDFQEHDYVILGTRDGYVKRTSTDEFENIRRTGIRAIELEERDEFRGACLMTDERDILMSTQNGRAIRFDGNDVRPMGRSARGVRGIELDEDDDVVAVNVVDEDDHIFSVTMNGYGKRTSISEYRPQTRNGRGLVDISTGERNGPVVAVEAATSGEFVTITEEGRTIHVPIDEVSVLSRNTKGIQIMGLESSDSLSNLAVFDI